MPAYDYTCAACGRRFEVIHGVHAEGPTACPLCGSGPVRKAITAPAVHYRGSGWAKKERRSSAPSAAGTSQDGEGGKESGAEEGGVKAATKDPASGSDAGSAAGGAKGSASSAKAASAKKGD